jgi:hypothetical protein
LTDSECIILLRSIFYSGIGHGLTCKHVVEYLFVASSNLAYGTESASTANRDQQHRFYGYQRGCRHYNNEGTL